VLARFCGSLMVGKDQSGGGPLILLA
jgi:hypothetical protein